MSRAIGQALAEAALAMPLFLVLVLGIADGGRAFYYREAVTNAARQALRVAVAPSATSLTAAAAACARGGPTGSHAGSLSVPLPDATLDPLRPIADAAALESTTDGTPGGTRLRGATLTVTWHCQDALPRCNGTGGIPCLAPETSTDPSDLQSAAIEVRIQYPFTPITPLVGRLFGSSTPTIGADVRGRAEY